MTDIASEGEPLAATLAEMSSPLDPRGDCIGIILAAGHGKRIRSSRSKMLHTIWGVPTVVRVANVLREGLGCDNQIVVVGIHGAEVAATVGAARCRTFVEQPEQKGTGDALRAAMTLLDGEGYRGDIFVLPGDMGLLDVETVRRFKEEFRKDECDMMVLTAIYEGPQESNYYGRVVRLPGEGNRGSVIAIREHKNILAMQTDIPYHAAYNEKDYRFSREELLALREFNTGVYAFRANALELHVGELGEDNVAGEYYLTDLVDTFNRHGLRVGAARAAASGLVQGFNVKSVWRAMEALARERVWERLKDVVTIEDREDFFIADDVVEALTSQDATGDAHDIVIGRGAFIGAGVKLSREVHIKNDARIDGDVHLADDVHVGEGVVMTTYPGQRMEIGCGTEILQGNVVQGNVRIGENVRVETGVRITGSDEYPVRIGKDVLIKGTSYIYGSVIDEGVSIEHSVLKCQHVKRVLDPDGKPVPVRYVLPPAEGLEALSNRPEKGDRASGD